MKNKKKSIYILYDYLKVKGGAEAVFECMLDTCGKQISNGVVDYISQGYDESSSVKCVQTLSNASSKNSFLNHFLTPYRFYKFSPKHTSKVVFFSGLYSLFSARNFPESCLKIYYCHTPPRHWYDLKSYYNENERFVVRVGLAVQKWLLRKIYERACKQQSLIIANSINVQQRIKKYLGLNSIVVYPPCNINDFRWIRQGDYYLSTARLEPYKRVELIIRTFMELPHKKLIVTSGGSQLEYLKKLAHGYTNISFTGWCSKKQLQTLMGNCLASIYIPMNEDFGISPIESMAAGKPVIGVAEGGVTETLIANQTGLLCPPSPKLNDITQAVEQMDAKTAWAMKNACEERAKHFSREVFENKIRCLKNASQQTIRQLAQGIDAS